MNQGIEILLARMDSHPDEFYNLHMQGNNPPGTRWDWLLAEALAGKFTTEEERTALQDKLSSIQGESFTMAVLKELMGDAAVAPTGGVTIQMLLKDLIGLPEHKYKTYVPNPTKAVLP